MKVLDLFSAAAGGWTLGLHRAGFETIAACEREEWRRILYSENNPGVRLYDDVCTLTGDQLLRDLGTLPDIIVGSPPCQDISSANTKGKGVDGERSGLFFEAIRIVGECRPRWVALENSADLRTRGADRVLAALEALGYAHESCVVGAGDGRRCAGVGANHERPRAWILAFDPEQLAHAAEVGPARFARQDPRYWRSQVVSPSGPGRCHDGNSDLQRGAAGFGPAAHEGGGDLARGRMGPHANAGRDGSLHDEHATGIGHEGGRARGRGPHGDGASSTGGGSSHTESHRYQGRSTHAQFEADGQLGGGVEAPDSQDLGRAAWPGPAGHARRADERDQPSDDAHSHGEGQPDGPFNAEVGWGSSVGGDAAGPWSQWNGGLAHHLRVDDGLSAWVAGTRVAVGGPRGAAAASLLVEAFGDAVLPQIPEAIGRAILRTEAALAAIYGRAAA